VRDSIHDLIEALYAAAQLVARDADHAASLVKEVLERAEEEDSLEPKDLFSELARLATRANGTGHSTAVRTGDLISSERVRDRLDAVLPDMMSGLPPARRLARRSAVRDGTGSGHGELDVFLAAVRRRLSSETGIAAIGCSPEELAAALERYFDTALAPVPPSLFEELERGWALPSGGLRADREDTEPIRLPWGARFAAAFLLILIAALIGMWLSRPPTPEPQTITVRSLLDVVVDTRPSSDLILRGREALGLEQFIQDRLDRRVRIPEITDARLSGMYVETLTGGVEIPILQFRNVDDSEFLIWVFDYAMLERLAPDIVVDPGVLNQIAADDAFDIRDSETSTLVVFRHRDDIYFAVTEGDGLAFRHRISFPS